MDHETRVTGCRGAVAITVHNELHAAPPVPFFLACGQHEVVTKAVDLVALYEHPGALASGSVASELLSNRPMRLTFEALLFIFLPPLLKLLFGPLTFLFNLLLKRDYCIDFPRYYYSCSCHDYSFLFVKVQR